MIENIKILEQQIQICKKYNVPMVECPYYLYIAIAKDFSKDHFPINGLRHPPEGITTGWYIWSGENFDPNPNKWEVVHVLHLFNDCPEIIKYLGLPPAWRFLIADNYDDVWSDEKLLDIDPQHLKDKPIFDYFKLHKQSLLK